MRSLSAEDGSGLMVNHAAEVLADGSLDTVLDGAQAGLTQAPALTPEDEARADLFTP